MKFNSTIYFDDFILYYHKAKKLQNSKLKNHTNFEKTGDDLMDNIPIYDTVQRRYAGFSNILQQLWYGSSNHKKHHIKKEYDVLHDRWNINTWIYIFLIHRLTGSGASFQHDHGFRNTIIPYLTKFNTIKEMVEFIKHYDKPMFTSIGNQIPPFPKPTNGYKTGGKLYICEYAPKLVEFIISSFDNKSTLQKSIDNMLDWQIKNNCKRYKFVLTAFAMDISEYFPEIICQKSHCYYGKNATDALNKMFNDKRKNNYDDKIEYICGLLNSKPMDIEDVLCDCIRYWNNYIPKGYNYYKNNSLIKKK